MNFEVRIQQHWKTKLLWCLIEWFDRPATQPQVGDSISAIVGNKDVYLVENVSVVNLESRQQPFDEYGYTTYEKLNKDGGLIKFGSVPFHRVVTNTKRTKRLLALVNAS